MWAEWQTIQTVWGSTMFPECGSLWHKCQLCSIWTQPATEGTETKVRPESLCVSISLSHKQQPQHHTHTHTLCHDTQKKREIEKRKKIPRLSLSAFLKRIEPTTYEHSGQVHLLLTRGQSIKQNHNHGLFLFWLSLWKSFFKDSYTEQETFILMAAINFPRNRWFL